MTLVCLTGLLPHIVRVVPIEAGMAIVLWIGIVITAQAFQATPVRHAPAVVLGILPGMAAWGTMLLKTALRAAGWGAPGGPAFDAGADELLAGLAASDVWAHGAFALEQGFIFTSIVLAAVTVAIIERRFAVGAAWCGVAALLSALGLMHAYAWTPGDTVIAFLDLSSWAAAWSSLRATAPFSGAYLALGLLLLGARAITEHDPAAGHAGEDG
jgi:AGZA family xanthine/uracil permease-like MFS transporter